MKQMKVLGVLAVALTLGLTACGGTKECKTHKWGEWEVVTAETCTTDGLQKRTCTVCKKVEEKKINKGHKWGSWATVEESTCTEQGSEKRTCSRCNEVETRPLDLAPHTYLKDAEGNDVIAWTTEPNCTDAGVGGHRTCSVCGAEIAVSSSEAAALGHDYKKDADGNIEFTWTTAPTCDLPGVGTKHCERCGQDVAATDEERAKLGHDVEAIGGEVTPTDGTAAVRLYHCKRCDQTFMGFLANEVTNESKAHVKFEPETVSEGQEQGARFLGRPIGNALALDSNGTSVNQQNGEIVYCSTETGDFIEYAFNLNATQAATLATCRLYCDAKPADYLNGTDFWAYGASNDEWTPGYYIDGGPERFQTNDDGTPKMVKDHAKAGFDSQPGAELETEVQIGKRIEDYRYVLYVDGNVVDFDPDTKNPTSGRDANMQRGEFELPYTFHLHEGLNKIKFVMAGGYRSLFYKCIFRPYVEPTPVTVNQSSVEMKVGETAQITSSMTDLKFESANASIATVSATGLVTGVKAGTTTISVSKDGNYKPAKVAVKVNEKDGIYQVEVETGTSNPANSVTFRVPSGGASGSMTDAFPKDSELTMKFNVAAAETATIAMTLRGIVEDLSTAMSVKVNNNDISLAGKSLNSQYTMTSIDLGRVDLTAGENTIVVKALGDSMPNLDFFRFEPAPLHTHEFVNPQNQTDEVESVISTCSCNLQRVRWDAKKYNTTESSTAVSTNEATGVSNDTNKGIKLGGDVYNKTSGTASNGTHVNYNVNVPAAKTGAKLYIRGVRNSSSAASMFSAMNNDNSPSYYQKEDGTWANYQWRYKLLINDVEVEFTPFAAGTEPQAPSKQYAEAAFPCTFNLKAGNNKIEIQKWGGYTLVITEFWLEF